MATYPTIVRHLADSYDQSQRVFRALNDRARRRAAAAHPATDGVRHLVSNWGNEEARAAWAECDRLWDRCRGAYGRREHDYSRTLAVPRLF